MSEEETIMSGEEIITEFIQNATGFRIVASDLTTGKVVVNNIEITSIEDWNKVTHSIVELQQENSQLKEQVQCLIKQRDDTNKSAVETIEKYQVENSQLKERIEKAIEYIESHKMIDYDEFEYLSTSPKHLIEILKGDKE